MVSELVSVKATKKAMVENQGDASITCVHCSEYGWEDNRGQKVEPWWSIRDRDASKESSRGPLPLASVSNSRFARNQLMTPPGNLAHKRVEATSGRGVVTGTTKKIG